MVNEKKVFVVVCTDTDDDETRLVRAYVDFAQANRHLELAQPFGEVEGTRFEWGVEEVPLEGELIPLALPAEFKLEDPKALTDVAERLEALRELVSCYRMKCQCDIPSSAAPVSRISLDVLGRAIPSEEKCELCRKELP